MIYTEDVEKIALEEMRSAVLATDKTIRDNNIDVLTQKVKEELVEKYPEAGALIGEAMYKLEKSVVRNYLLKEHKRVDGRGLEEIRRSAPKLAFCREHTDPAFSAEDRHKF